MFATIMTCMLMPVTLPASEAPGAQPTRIRIGTYDNRAVAVAYAASTYNPVKDKMHQYQKAKEAGDANKIKELESWGEHHQTVLHFQGFGRVPVTDLLEPVKERVKQLAKEKGLSAITMHCDFTSTEVELVDVTIDLVKLYDPTEKTLKMAEQSKHAPVIDLVKLSKIPAKNK